MKSTFIVLGLLMLGLLSAPAGAGCGCGMASCSGEAGVLNAPVDWSSVLMLSDTQKQQLHQVLKAQEPQMQALQKKHKELLAQLKGLIQTNVAETTRVDAIEKQLQETEQSIQKSHYDLWGKVADLLGPTQRAKFLLTYAERWQMEAPVALEEW